MLLPGPHRPLRPFTQSRAVCRTARRAAPRSCLAPGSPDAVQAVVGDSLDEDAEAQTPRLLGFTFQDVSGWRAVSWLECVALECAALECRASASLHGVGPGGGEVGHGGHGGDLPFAATVPALPWGSRHACSSQATDGLLPLTPCQVYYYLNIGYWSLLLLSVLTGNDVLSRIAQFETYTTTMFVASAVFSTFFGLKWWRDARRKLLVEQTSDWRALLRYAWNALFWLGEERACVRARAVRGDLRVLFVCCWWRWDGQGGGGVACSLCVRAVGLAGRDRWAIRPPPESPPL